MLSCRFLSCCNDSVFLGCVGCVIEYLNPRFLHWAFGPPVVMRFSDMCLKLKKAFRECNKVSKAYLYCTFHRHESQRALHKMKTQSISIEN